MIAVSNSCSSSDMKRKAKLILPKIAEFQQDDKISATEQDDVKIRSYRRKGKPGSKNLCGNWPLSDTLPPIHHLMQKFNLTCHRLGDSKREEKSRPRASIGDANDCQVTPHSMEIYLRLQVKAESLPKHITVTGQKAKYHKPTLNTASLTAEWPSFRWQFPKRRKTGNGKGADYTDLTCLLLVTRSTLKERLPRVPIHDWIPGSVGIPTFHCGQCLQHWKMHGDLPEECDQPEEITLGPPMFLAHGSHKRKQLPIRNAYTKSGTQLHVSVSGIKDKVESGKTLMVTPTNSQQSLKDLLWEGTEGENSREIVEDDNAENSIKVHLTSSAHPNQSVPSSQVLTSTSSYAVTLPAISNSESKAPCIGKNTGSWMDEYDGNGVCQGLTSIVLNHSLQAKEVSLNPGMKCPHDLETVYNDQSFSLLNFSGSLNSSIPSKVASLQTQFPAENEKGCETLCAMKNNMIPCPTMTSDISGHGESRLHAQMCQGYTKCTMDQQTIHQCEGEQSHNHCRELSSDYTPASGDEGTEKVSKNNTLGGSRHSKHAATQNTDTLKFSEGTNPKGHSNCRQRHTTREEGNGTQVDSASNLKNRINSVRKQKNHSESEEHLSGKKLKENLSSDSCSTVPHLRTSSEKKDDFRHMPTKAKLPSKDIATTHKVTLKENVELPGKRNMGKKRQNKLGNKSHGNLHAQPKVTHTEKTKRIPHTSQSTPEEEHDSHINFSLPEALPGIGSTHDHVLNSTKIIRNVVKVQDVSVPSRYNSKDMAEGIIKSSDVHMYPSERRLSLKSALPRPTSQHTKKDATDAKDISVPLAKVEFKDTGYHSKGTDKEPPQSPAYTNSSAPTASITEGTQAKSTQRAPKLHIRHGNNGHSVDEIRSANTNANETSPQLLLSDQPLPSITDKFKDRPNDGENSVEIKVSRSTALPTENNRTCNLQTEVQTAGDMLGGKLLSSHSESTCESDDDLDAGECSAIEEYYAMVKPSSFGLLNASDLTRPFTYSMFPMSKQHKDRYIKIRSKVHSSVHKHSRKQTTIKS